MERKKIENIGKARIEKRKNSQLPIGNGRRKGRRKAFGKMRMRGRRAAVVNMRR